ncbi:MAG: prepilin-type N-terminal cleavage/methylation domain-containing protein [Armatimonadetes bacterium]|nr:prepilin-type N-terminal cleavage/methylation domain-containing protein [Armatimonadota bacterium]
MKRAFTLIELLVVIAIIAILAAILFPVFAQAKASAQSARCLVQMRQLGLALTMYMGDNDDTWAPSVVADDSLPVAPQRTWIGYDNTNGDLLGGFFGRATQPAIASPRTGLIDSYLKNYDIRKCPSMPGQWQLAVAYNWFNPGKPSDFYTSHPGAAGQEYGPGARTSVDLPDGRTTTTGANDSEMEEPSSTLVLWEHEARVPMCNFLQAPDWFTSPPNDPVLRDHFHFLHRDAANTVFGDTHAKRHSYPQLRRRMFSMRKDIYEGL